MDLRGPKGLGIAKVIGMSKTAEEILQNLDLYDEDQREHLLEAFDVARQECPVVYTETDGGYYVVTRYEDVRTVLLNPETFSSVRPSVRGTPVRLPPLDSDPPLHGEFRRHLNRYFSRSFLLRYEAVIRELAHDTILEFIDRCEVEFVREFSIPFSAGSLTRIVFDTDDQGLIERGTAAVHRLAVESTPDAFLGVSQLATEQLKKLDDGAAGGDSLLAGLLEASVDGGRPLTQEERLGIVTVLLIGGLDTTRGMITNIAYRLATEDGIEEVIREPDWWRTKLDEFLRLDPTVAHMARTCTRDFNLGGVALKSGDRLVVNFYSANHDPERFERPNELLFDRDSNPHVSFGLGSHRCLGLNFARLQIAIAFEELLRLATNFRLAGGKAIPRQMGMTYNSPSELHVAFDKR